MNRRLPLTEAEVIPISDCEEPGVTKFMDVHSRLVSQTGHQPHEAHERDREVETAEGMHVERARLDLRQARRSACRPSRRKRRCAGCTTKPDTAQRQLSNGDRCATARDSAGGRAWIMLA